MGVDGEGQLGAHKGEEVDLLGEGGDQGPLRAVCVCEFVYARVCVSVSLCARACECMWVCSRTEWW
jgi:hypothetical protein